jgi:hypothetical protein
MSLVKRQRAIDRPPEVQSETANGAPASDSRYAGVQIEATSVPMTLLRVKRLP